MFLSVLLEVSLYSLLLSWFFLFQRLLNPVPTLMFKYIPVNKLNFMILPNFPFRVSLLDSLFCSLSRTGHISFQSEWKMISLPFLQRCNFTQLLNKTNIPLQFFNYFPHFFNKLIINLLITPHQSIEFLWYFVNNNQMSILIYFLKRFLQLEINLNPIDILLDSVEICLKI